MMGGVPLDGDVLVPDLFLGDLDVLDPLFGNVLGDVLAKVLDGVVVGDCDLAGDGLDLPLLLVFDPLDLLGDPLDLGLVLVLDNLLLEGDVLDPALSLDDLLSGVDCGPHHLGAASHCHSSSHSLGPLDPLHSLNSVAIAGALSVGVGGGGCGDVGGIGCGHDVVVGVDVVSDGLSGLPVDKLAR